MEHNAPVYTTSSWLYMSSIWCSPDLHAPPSSICRRDVWDNLSYLKAS